MFKIACLFSGGKDSVFSAFWAMFSGWDPTLVTIKPEPYSMMFHHPNVEWTKLQAKAMRLPHVFMETKGKDELRVLEETIGNLHVDGIVAGALDSEYQRQRIEQIGENLGLPTYNPLWRKREGLYSEVMEYFETYFTAVSAQGMGKELLGKRFELQKGDIHPFLEGGEGETFVADAPFFEKRIEIEGWNIEWDGVRGTAEIKNARLVEK
ncbi:diphthine--ammonia ligase [Candidatus Micrarchaeota archaeon]|nr:diphthine--ammonia ligase [Candidatus Micrarchaeota archaeon]